MTQTGSDSVDTKGPTGIGGWLILPIMGLIVTPVRGIGHLASYGPLLEAAVRLNGAQAAFIYGEFICNVAILLVLPGVLLFLLVRRSALFPKLFVVWALAGLAFVILDILVAQAVFSVEIAASGDSLLDEVTLVELGRSIVTAVIWVPYMRMSRRVANTFVN